MGYKKGKKVKKKKGYAHGGSVEKFDSTSNAGKKSNPTKHYADGGKVKGPKKAPFKARGGGAATKGTGYHRNA